MCLLGGKYYMDMCLHLECAACAFCAGEQGSFRFVGSVGLVWSEDTLTSITKKFSFVALSRVGRVRPG